MARHAGLAPAGEVFAADKIERLQNAAPALFKRPYDRRADDVTCEPPAENVGCKITPPCEERPFTRDKDAGTVLWRKRHKISGDDSISCTLVNRDSKVAPPDVERARFLVPRLDDFEGHLASSLAAALIRAMSDSSNVLVRPNGL